MNRSFSIEKYYRNFINYVNEFIICYSLYKNVNLFKNLSFYNYHEQKFNFHRLFIFKSSVKTLNTNVQLIRFRFDNRVFYVVPSLFSSTAN